MYKLPALALFAALVVPAHGQIAKVVNGASFVENRSLTPGSIITILGANLSNQTAYAAPSSTMPSSLGGVTVTIGATPVPLFYVSPGQVNAQIPASVAVGTATLTVASPAGTYTASLTIAAAGAPGVFSMNGSGTRDGAILNAVTFAPGPFTVRTGGAPTYIAIYATGLDLSAKPKVLINGVEVPVLSAGAAPGFVGLQQINAQLIDSLAGAGRVEVAVVAGGKTSNIVEIVILPNPGQTPLSNQFDGWRSRSLASLAWIPGTSRVLVADESDDVVRLVDLKQQKTLQTIALPDGAEPVAIAVNGAGTRAIVAERNLGKVAILDIAGAKVLFEVKVGSGPTALGILAGTPDIVCVVNQDTDNLSVFQLVDNPTVNTVKVGRAPRGVSIDAVAKRAFITNQGDGTVSVVSLVDQNSAFVQAVSATFNLGTESRPHSIQVVPSLGLALITDPSATAGGKVLLINSGTGVVAATLSANPDGTGGASDIALAGSNVYFANQTGGTITVATLTGGNTPSMQTSTITVDIGARALAVDTVDNWLVVCSEGSGTLVLVDLATNKVVGRISAVRSEDESEDRDDRDDHDRAHNLPVITSITPATGKPGDTIATMTITGKNFTGATSVTFVNPDTLPGRGLGRGNGASGAHAKGPFGQTDTMISVSNQVVKSATEISVTVTINPKAEKGVRVVRVATPNGDSSFVVSDQNTFKVVLP